MATSYYLDTSALGKRYVNEIGSAWIHTLTAPTAGHALVTARITMAEMYSVLGGANAKGQFRPRPAPSPHKHLPCTARPNTSSSSWM